MTYVITNACVDVKDRSCIDQCPVDCIYEGERSMYINPDECIDCGACEVACPTGAVYFDVELPVEMEPSIQSNLDFFVLPLAGRDAALGKPGGFRHVGPIPADSPHVASLPRAQE
jgi:NAD-dependent dihydropyrimidine dehydrogenase PreA subunit